MTEFQKTLVDAAEISVNLEIHHLSKKKPWIRKRNN